MIRCCVACDVVMSCPRMVPAASYSVHLTGVHLDECISWAWLSRRHASRRRASHRQYLGRVPGTLKGFPGSRSYKFRWQEVLGLRPTRLVWGGRASQRRSKGAQYPLRNSTLKVSIQAGGNEVAEY